MAKYKKRNFYHASKVIDDERLDGLPYQSIYIYNVMEELEHKYTSEDKTYFFHSDEDFARDCRMPLSTFKRYKKSLIERNNELTTEYMPLFVIWQDASFNHMTGKKSTKHITHYAVYGSS
jgi:hypothetical protein